MDNNGNSNFDLIVISWSKVIVLHKNAKFEVHSCISFKVMEILKISWYSSFRVNYTSLAMTDKTMQRLKQITL